ncbi:Putative ribonuclease H protein At1g65750 [Linum perenne]
MKVAWNIVSRHDELWVKALSNKYLVRSSRGFMLRSNSGHSSLWRGVLKVWENTLNGIQFNINDGKSTRFWTDRWLDSGDVLIDSALNIQGVDSSLSVSSFVTSDGCWNIDALNASLTHSAVLQVMGMTPPSDRLSVDTISWGLEASGRFTINLAYLYIKDLRIGEQDKIWSKVWRWDGPTKVRQFLWLSVHGKLMTNDERRKRHVATDAACPECRGGCENVEHVLRRCEFAELVWREMIPELSLSATNDLAFQDWWYRGLCSSELRSRDWQVSVHHIFREANFAADYLANLGQSLQLGVHVLDSPDSVLADWLRFDLVGSCTTRLINNM